MFPRFATSRPISVFAPLVCLLVVLMATASVVTVTSGPAQAATGVRLTASDSTPVVDSAVVLTAVVTPAGPGRTVLFEQRFGTSWRSIGRDSTNRLGVATTRVRFAEAGPVTVRAVALRHRGLRKRIDTLRLSVAKAATRVDATLTPGPWTVGQQVGVPLSVRPGDPGRRAWLERRVAGSWVPVSDPVLTDTRGEAVVVWTPTAVGTSLYRVAVAASAARRATASESVDREIRAAAGAALTITAPARVGTGDTFDVDLGVVAGTQSLDDAVLTVHAPERGTQVTPPDELDFDPVTGTAVLDLGDLAPEAERRVVLRWQAPGSADVLEVAAELAADGVAEEATHVVEVTEDGGGGGFLFDAGLRASTEPRDAPAHHEGLFGICLGGAPAPRGEVPTFAAALSQAEAHLASQMEGRSTAEWEELAAQDDADLFDDVAAVAFTALRYDGALAASLRGHELDPDDGAHLSNAAAAANLIDRPDWAIAFARKAAEARGSTSVGVHHEAARLVNLGHAWALKGQYAGALSALRQAAALDPNSQAVRAELGAVLLCSGDKEGALPHLRRSLRVDDTPDPIVDDHEDESMRRSRIDTSTVYDLSGGVQQELGLPYFPATWGELAGMARSVFGGSNYYERENEAVKARAFELIDERNELEAQLRASQADASPVEVRTTNAVLRRIGTHADQDLIDARAAYLEVTARTFRPNSCDDMFTTHPFCAADGWEYTCADSQPVFDEYERRMEAHLTALATYHDAVAQHFSGLQAQLSDPVAHALAGVIAEQHFVTEVWSITANLRQSADAFHNLSENWDGRDEDEDPPCVGMNVPEDQDPVTTVREAAAACAPGSDASKVNLALDFEVVAIKVSCEKWSVEATRDVAWLQAFAKYEAAYGNNGATLNIGVKAGALGASFESGLYLQQDATGKVVDFGWQVGPEFEPGNVLTISAYEDKVKISFMSLFVGP